MSARHSTVGDIGSTVLSQRSSGIWRHSNTELRLGDIIAVESNGYGADAFRRKGRVSEDQILFVSHREEATEATVKRIRSESHGKKTYRNTTWLIWANSHSRYSPRRLVFIFLYVTSMMSPSMTPLYKELREASKKLIKLLNQFRLFQGHQRGMNNEACGTWTVLLD